MPIINGDPYPFIVKNWTVIGVRYFTHFVRILQKMLHMYRNGFLNLLNRTGYAMHQQV